MGSVLLVAMVVGCAAQSQTTAGEGEHYDAAKAVAAEDLMVMEPGKATYLRTHKGKEKRVTFELAKVDAQTWTWAAEDFRVTTLSIDDDGGIRIKSDIEFDEDADARYAPPLPMLPAKLEPDKPVTAESKMTVYDANGKKIKAKGTCRVTIELLGKRSVDTPIGPIECYVIRTTRKIDLDLANVEVVIHNAYAPALGKGKGSGLVRQAFERHTKALGLLGGKTAEELVLTE